MPIAKWQENGMLAKSNALPQSFLASNEQITIGIDLQNLLIESLECAKPA